VKGISLLHVANNKLKNAKIKKNTQNQSVILLLVSAVWLFTYFYYVY